MRQMIERTKVSAAAELAGGTSWKDDVQAYERARRHEIAPGLVAGPPMRMDPVKVKLQERTYDPLLGRFRDESRETRQRGFEDHERMKHMNRAKDIQILREQPFNITNLKTRLAPATGGEQRQELAFADPSTSALPTTMVDYNIISNFPLDVHHWAHPEHRPVVTEKHGKTRRVAASNLKDFNVISNRYLQGHEEKTSRDNALLSLEATSKYRSRSRFDPVKQTFTCPREEARQRCYDDANDQGPVLNKQANQPPSFTGRHTAFYDAISHQVHDPDMMNVLDTAEHARNHRYRSGHVQQHMLKQQEILFEDACVAQKSENIDHERFEETTRRGYDVITNRNFGERPHEQKMHPPYTLSKLRPWEKVLTDRDDTPPAAQPPSGGGAVSARGARDHKDGPAALHASGGSRRSAPLSARAASTGASSARGAAPRAEGFNTQRALLKMAAVEAVGGPRPPPAPAIPGSPVGSVYSRPKAS